MNVVLLSLKGLTADNPDQRKRLLLLEPKVLAKLAELQSTIQLYQDHDPAGALAIVKSDRGKNLMDDIRALVGQIEKEERGLLERRSNESQRALRHAVVSLFLASFAVLLFLLGTAIGVRQYLKYRHATEERIRGERKWLEVTLGSIGDGVVATDNASRVVFLNKTAESLTGWTESLARGKPLDEVFRIVHEQSRQPVESPVTRALREGIVVGLANHTVLLARDGRELPIDDSAAPIFDESGRVFGVVLVFRDATKERQAEATLQKLAAIVEFSDDAMISKTIDGTITSWNAAAERLLGYTAAEAIGNHIGMIVPPDRQDELAEIMRKLRAGERLEHLDTVRRRKDGSRLNVSLQISPIRNSYGEVIGASKVIRDISEQRKRSEESPWPFSRARQRCPGRPH